MPATRLEKSGGEGLEKDSMPQETEKATMTTGRIPLKGREDTGHFLWAR